MLSEKRTVLVVEDEILIRTCTADFLEDAGYRVLEAANGSEALKILRHHPEIALLLTDVNMPGGPDGLTVAENASWQNPDIRTVVVSGKRPLRDDQIPGGGRFVAKPYSPQQIIDTVGMLLA